MADKDYFEKKYGDKDAGYTWEEAMKRKEKIDESYGANLQTAKWNKAVIEKDPNKKSGYRIVIERKI